MVQLGWGGGCVVFHDEAIKTSSNKVRYCTAISVVNTVIIIIIIIIFIRVNHIFTKNTRYTRIKNSVTITI